MYNETDLIMDHTLEMIIVFDGNGNIEDYNQEAVTLLGYDKELAGTSLEHIFPQIFTEDKSFADILRDNLDKKISDFAYRQNRTCFPADLKIHCIDETDGKYVCMIIDKIEQTALEKELVQVREEALLARKVQNEFTANVTHELRTPVNGILGHVQNLLEETSDKKVLEILEIIQHCCNNMNKIINNILDFSKLSAGKFTIEERKFDVYKMMKHVSDTSIAKIQEKNLAFSIHIADNVPAELIGDELRITQVLNNLISNAIKFTQKGRIGVEVTKTYNSADEVELFFMVIDTGIGIDEKDKDKLFKDFSQVDASISRKFGGTGLGLSICKQLVELMKGNIYVQSEKGKGSEFSFSVRLKKAGEDSNVIVKNTEEITYTGVLEEYNSTDYLNCTEVDVNKEIISTLEKLVLCIDLETWDKAEQFAINIKNLGSELGDDFRRAVVRVEMAIRKENYEKSVKAYEQLKELYESKVNDTGGSL